ncbi:uncharacterized protein LOC125371690 [Haliotis rufescens]|uniref:uncharacterized protein LOC125371690 n=1 Tax=Haliotis rufescens TaxID=6454 RepID=UPI00201EFF57|nr:uncharacterized protein LOC125371690 [Haliotis rufescens]
MFLVRALLVLLVSDESLRSASHAELTDPVKTVGEITTVNTTGFSFTDPTYTKMTMRKETASRSGEATSSDTTTVAMMQTSDKATRHHTPISDTKTLQQTKSAGPDSATPPTMTTKQQEPSATYMTVNYVLPTPPPLKVRKLNAFDTASRLFREFPSQVVASESEYCGKTCHFKYKNKRTSLRPSCETCRCDGDCVLYDDCCPDFVILGNQTTVAAPYSCENTSPDFLEQTSDWYYMIRSCADTPTPGLVQECLDQHSKDWEHQVPVEDARTGDLYRNKFCALCNNVTLFNNWDTQIKCSLYPSGFKEAKSAEETYNIALEASICYIKFLPTSHTVLRPCNYREESVISSCNVTGQWEVYDKRVIEACERFTHVVNGKYRNVFCYLCNTNDDWRYILNEYVLQPAVVDSVGLTSLLNFRQKTLEVFEPRKNGCGRKQLYDNIIIMDGQPYLLFSNGEDNKILAFSTQHQLETLQSDETIYRDGTFSSCPALRDQVSILHARCGFVNYPLAFTLLPDRQMIPYH